MEQASAWILDDKAKYPYFHLMKEQTATLSVTSKGQVTFRRAILDHLGVGPGDRLVVELLPDGLVNVHAARRGHIDDFIGALAVEGQRTVTLEEIKEAIEAGWAGGR